MHIEQARASLGRQSSAHLGHQALVRTIAVVALVYGVYYITWRATDSLNFQALTLSLILLCAEAWGLLNGLIFAFMTWDTERRPAFSLKPGQSVDVFVPTYNEGLDILEATLAGCQQMA